MAEDIHSQYDEGDTLREMMVEDLVAECIAIDSYREIIQWLGDRHPTTRNTKGVIHTSEEKHADDLISLLAGMPTQASGEGKA